MAPSEDEPPSPVGAGKAVKAAQIVPEPPRYGRYVVLLAIVILGAITVNTLVTKPNGDKGVQVGLKVPPFAVPLALGTLEGDANVATGPNQGEAGHVAACTVHETGAMNICELYEDAPVVLAMFVDADGCPDVLKEMQALVSVFPQVHFAAVALKNGHAEVRKLVQKLHLSFPVGVDRSGTLAALYGVATCPQVSFLKPGGVVQSPALLNTPSAALLRERVRRLVAVTGGGG